MTSSQNISHLSILLCITIGFAACDETYLLSDTKGIPNAQWSYSDTLDFKVPINDTTQLYNLYIQFAYADTFPYQNIYLKLSTKFPDGKRVSRVRAFDLFDIQGNPSGNCSGKTCQARIMLQDNLYFNQIGDYIITLEQFTRSNSLPGLISVGIMMEKVEKKR